MTPSDAHASFQLTVDGSRQSVALVLSATEDSYEARAAILTQTLRLLRQLPARIDVSVYLLGSPQRYDMRQIEEHGDSLLRDHVGHVSLFAPVMRSLVQTSVTTRVAILGAKRVFDLSDWVSVSKPIIWSSEHGS